MVKSSDAKRLKEYDITIYDKGFVAISVTNNNVFHEFFQYKQIYNILHHPSTGVEVLFYNGYRRVFYHSLPGESQFLFDMLHGSMTSWLGSNLN